MKKGEYFSKLVQHKIAKGYFENPDPLSFYARGKYFPGTKDCFYPIFNET